MCILENYKKKKNPNPNPEKKTLKLHVLWKYANNK